MNEVNTLEAFQTKFRVRELEIIDNGAWTWSVRPDQPTLGAGVISLNRYARHLSEVGAEEMAALAGLISALEKSVKRAFNYDIMNYLMLMMVDHHVHYHVLPRYDGSRQFAGLEWVDNGWPTLPLIADSQHRDQDGILQKIQDALTESV